MSEDAVAVAMMRLKELSDEDLFKELGLRQMLVPMQPSLAGTPDPPLATAAGYGIHAEDLAKFGKRYFARINSLIFDLLCGNKEEDEELRKKLRESLGIGELSFSTALAYALAQHFGITFPVAVALSAIVTRLFVAAGSVTCDIWKQRL